MKKTKISIYFDSLLISFSSFVVLFLWINQKIKNAKTSFFVCIFITMLIFYVIFKHLNNKYNLSKIKSFEQKHAFSCLEKLTFSSEEFCQNFINSLLNSHTLSDKLFENEQFYFCINLKTISDENLFHCANNFFLKTSMSKPLIFITNEQSDSFQKLISNSPIKYKSADFYELYSLMKHNNYYPENINNSKVRQKNLKNFKNKLSQSLSRKSFFKYFISGLSLIILSIYIPFSFYYLLFGSLLFIFSILCLFSKSNHQTKTNTDLISLIKKDWQICQSFCFIHEFPNHFLWYIQQNQL